MTGRSQILTVAGIVCIVLASVVFLTLPPAEAELADPYLVAEEAARDHATAALVEFIVAGPGLTEGEAWRSATIGAGSVLFFDRNGRPFVYHYPVESGGVAIGSIKVAARTVLGGGVIEYGTTPSTFDPEDAIPLAVAAAERTYPGWNILDALPCYAPPVTGVLVRAITVNDTETLLLIDPVSGRMVEREPADEGTAAVDHRGRVLNEDEIEDKIADWRGTDARYREILAFAGRHGIDLRLPLSEEDFELYEEFFESRKVSPTRTPPPSTPIPESELIARQKELEEWQRTVDWEIAVAYDAGMPDDEISAVIEEHLGEGSIPGGIKTGSSYVWLCLNATNAEFAGYRDRLENHATVQVVDASEAFFMSLLENPRTAGDRTLWLFSISHDRPEMDPEEITSLLLAEGFPLEEMRFARMNSYPGDRDGREQFAQRLNADARLLFVMKEYRTGGGLPSASGGEGIG
jgi:hypothetical protein